MTCVTRSNFCGLYPNLIREIGTCDFITVDLEYSCISSHRGSSYRLFDTLQQRYNNVRDTVSQCAPFQVGLTLFSHDPVPSQSNAYFSGLIAANNFSVKAYNFILLSPSLQQMDKPFLCSPSTLSFLQDHGMVFDEIIRSGVPFLNSEDLSQVKRLLQTDVKLLWCKHNQDKFEIQCKMVVEWYNGQGMYAGRDTLDLEPVLENDYIYPNLHDLRLAFPDLLFEFQEQVIRVFKGLPERKSLIDLREYRMDSSSDAHSFIEELLGMSRIFQFLFSVKKPLVVHNGFFDLLSIYEKFYEPLPEKVETFMANIHRLIPEVYDTKSLFYCLRPLLRDVSTNTNDLCGLYNCLRKKVDEGIVMGLRIRSPFDESTGQAHDAAYDAFMTGSVFLYLGHLMYIRYSVLSSLPTKGDSFLTGENTVTIESSEQQQIIARLVGRRKPSFRAYQAYLADHGNKINLIRARQDCLSLGRKEHSSRVNRPPLLVLTVSSDTCKQLNKENEGGDDVSSTLDLNSLASMLSEHGMADIRHLPESSSVSVTRYLVAMASWSGARSAVRAIRNDKRMSIREFDPWTDGKPVWSLLGIFTAASFMTFLSGSCLYAGFRSSILNIV